MGKLKYESNINNENQRIIDVIENNKYNKRRKINFMSFLKAALAGVTVCSLCLNGVMIYKNIELNNDLQNIKINNNALTLNVERLRNINEEYENEAVLMSERENEVVGAISEMNAFDDWKEGDETVIVNDVKLPWYLVLVNYKNQIADHFEVELEAVGKYHNVDKRAAAQLEKMLSDGTSEGLSFEICSSYRNIEKQMKLFQTFINDLKREGYTYEQAFFKAKRTSAIPGYSEHHTGLAVDIVSKSYKGLDRKQAQTAEFKWLEKNCHKYGFILRYPVDKYDITGIDYEPWHFRYVGESVAKYITENDLTLEEYLDSYIEAREKTAS